MTRLSDDAQNHNIGDYVTGGMDERQDPGHRREAGRSLYRAEWQRDALSTALEKGDASPYLKRTSVPASRLPLHPASQTRHQDGSPAPAEPGIGLHVLHLLSSDLGIRDGRARLVRPGHPASLAPIRTLFLPHGLTGVQDDDPALKTVTASSCSC